MEHTFAGEHPLGGTRHSREAVGPWFARPYQLFPGLDFAVKRMLVRGWPWRTVAMVGRVDQARPAEGVPDENEGTHVLRFSWGRLVGIHPYPARRRSPRSAIASRRGERGGAPAPPILA